MEIVTVCIERDNPSNPCGILAAFDDDDNAHLIMWAVELPTGKVVVTLYPELDTPGEISFLGSYYPEFTSAVLRTLDIPDQHEPIDIRNGIGQARWI